MSDVRYVKGLSELQAFLDQLPAKMEKNVMRAGLRAGAKVVAEEAKAQLAANNSVDTGLLQRGLRVSTSGKNGTVTAHVKVKGKHSYVAHWVEYGTRPHQIVAKKAGMLRFIGENGERVLVKSVNHPGADDKPFMRPALDTKAGEALVAVGRAVQARLTKEGLDSSYLDIEEVS